MEGGTARFDVGKGGEYSSITNKTHTFDSLTMASKKKKEKKGGDVEHGMVHTIGGPLPIARQDEKPIPGWTWAWEGGQWHRARRLETQR